MKGVDKLRQLRETNLKIRGIDIEEYESLQRKWNVKPQLLPLLNKGKIRQI